MVGKAMTKFKVGSHSLKIETGRWSRTPRAQRLCGSCNEFGDEFHALYHCSKVYREDLVDLPPRLAELWDYEGVNTLFQRMCDAEMVGC